MTQQTQILQPIARSRGGRLAGMLLILLGAGLLVYVFLQSYGMLTHSIPGMALPPAHASSHNAASASTVDFGKLGSSAIAFLLKLAVLLVMTVIGSIIAARGVHLYYVASAVGAVARASSASSSALGTAGAPALSLTDTPNDPAAQRLTGGQRQ